MCDRIPASKIKETWSKKISKVESILEQNGSIGVSSEHKISDLSSDRTIKNT